MLLWLGALAGVVCVVIAPGLLVLFYLGLFRTHAAYSIASTKQPCPIYTCAVNIRIINSNDEDCWEGGRFCTRELLYYLQKGYMNEEELCWEDRNPYTCLA